MLQDDFKEALPNGTEVIFDYQFVKGVGRVVGISSFLPDTTLYIVQTDGIISEVYPYTTFVCPDCYLTKKDS